MSEGIMKKKEKILPSSKDWFLKEPLYSSYIINDSNYREVIRTEFFQGTLDTYCLECERESVFQSEVRLPIIEPIAHNQPAKNLEELLSKGTAWFIQEELNAGVNEIINNHALKDRTFIVKFYCTRVPLHPLFFYFLVKNSTLSKIGQYPSIADLQTDVLKKYRKTLDKQLFGEFNRAIVLYTHDIGIGSFVYLRRIFESLIEKAHTMAFYIEGWDEEKYKKCGVDERILLLRKYLPNFLVENRKIYIILSKGIHSLTEDECLQFFEPIKLGIELILDEKIEQEEKTLKISSTRKNLESIKSKLQQ